MKITDDYLGKLDLWVKNPRVIPLPQIKVLPKFKAKKFKSYEEMNRWKIRYLEEIAENGGAKWTK
jgi:hypothetical protein